MLERTRLGNLVSSHQIENLPLTPQAAQRALDTRKGATPVEVDFLSFTAVYDDMHERERPKLPKMTVKTIRTFHKILFGKGGALDAGTPGELKTVDNGVKDEMTGLMTFHATPWQDTEAELEALCAWYHGPAQELPPPVAAGLFFVEFEAIHPFPDGNGRLGRLLNLVALRRFGCDNAFLVPIDERFRAHREKYYAALQATNLGGNYHVWLRFYLDQLGRAYEEANRRDVYQRVLDLPKRPSSRAVLQWVLARPDDDAFARSDYPNPTRLSEGAISQALRELADLGLLTSRGAKRWTRYSLDQERLRRILKPATPKRKQSSH
jgi:Fic family protein